MKKGISLTVFAGLCAFGTYLTLDKPTPIAAISNKVSTSTGTVAEQEKATSLFEPSTSIPSSLFVQHEPGIIVLMGMA